MKKYNHTALVLSKALINVGSTLIVAYFSLKKFFVLLYFYDKTRVFFSFWDVLFLLFISLITTNTSCHPLLVIFREKTPMCIT